MIANSLQDALAEIGLFDNTISLSQETTISRSETSSTWLIEPIGNRLQDSPFETISSSWHPTMSPPLDLQYMQSQLHVAVDGANRFDISMCVTNTEVPELAVSSRCSKSRHRSLRIFGNKIKRRRTQDTVLADANRFPQFCDPHNIKKIRECISNLLYMASHGSHTISLGFVECIVKALVSSVDTPMPRQTLCRYHRLVPNRIEPNRIASMEVLRLLQSAKTLQLQKSVHNEWFTLERDLLFDRYIQLPSQNPELEEIHMSESSQAADDALIELSSSAVTPTTKSAATNVQKLRRASIFSRRSTYGRIDICSFTEFGIGTPETYDYTAEVVWTVPTNELGSAQIRFFLSQNVAPERSILMTPMISVKPMRPKDSKIFKIAAFGTLDALIDMVLAGEASLADRDEDGRSLINVSVPRLSETVTETPVVCNFLL